MSGFENYFLQIIFSTRNFAATMQLPKALLSSLSLRPRKINGMTTAKAGVSTSVELLSQLNETTRTSQYNHAQLRADWTKTISESWLTFSNSFHGCFGQRQTLLGNEMCNKLSLSSAPLWGWLPGPSLPWNWICRNSAGGHHEAWPFDFWHKSNDIEWRWFLVAIETKITKSWPVFQTTSMSLSIPSPNEIIQIWIQVLWPQAIPNRKSWRW